ncbi:MAG: LysR family transcriptional regulator [Rhizobiales bacterium]|nr:LysR family transcriptional regulator [Hyphomicrobiales bacterium]
MRQAADFLGVTQPTIARRIRALEADLGIPLFERSREGHHLTAAGAELLPEARRVESAGLRFEQRSLGLLTGLRETVRVGAGETAAAVLARGLHLIEGGPTIELVVSDVSSPIESRAPEILVRHGVPEVETGLTRRVGSINCALYGAHKLGENRALPLLQSKSIM